MTSKIDLLLEAERRGILPENKKPLLAEARRRGLVPGGEPEKVEGAERFVRRVAEPLTFGFADKFAALTDAVRHQVVPFEGMEEQGFNEVYGRRLQGHQARTAEAMGTAEDGGQFVSDVAASTLGLGGFAGAASKLPALSIEKATDLIRQGFAFGAAGGAGHTEGGMQTLADMTAGGLEGVTFATGFANAFRGLGAGRDWLSGRMSRGAEERALRAQEMQDVAGEEFGPAIAGSGTAQKTAVGLGASPVGGPVRDQAGRVIEGIEQTAQRRLREEGAGRSSDEMGQETQELLRRQLTEREIGGKQVSSEEIRKMTPEQLQDITGMPLPEKHSPSPPRVAPVKPRDVEPVSPEAYLDEVARSVPEVQPRQITSVEGRVQAPKVEEVPVPPRLAERARSTEARMRDAEEELAALEALSEKMEAPLRDEMVKLGLKDFKWSSHLNGYIGIRNDGTYFIPHNPSYAGKPAERQFAEKAIPWLDAQPDHQAKIADLKQSITGYRADHADAVRAIDEHQASGIGRLTKTRRDDALRAANEEERSRAALETQRAREEAVARETPAAVQSAAKKTEEMRATARADADAETTRLQTEANDRHAAELAERRARPVQTFELGQGPQSRDATYVAEADAAYAMGRRHTPQVQQSPLGYRGGPQTNTTKLLESVAEEARGGGLMPGYRRGQLFDETGALNPDVMAFLRPRLGDDIASRLEYLSQRRAARGRQFTPGIQGLHDMRTAIDRAIRDAGRGRTPGETRGPDEALLVRLRKAFADDIDNFRSQTPEGQVATELRHAQDRQYDEMLNDLRRPLERLFGENVTPVQAMDRLANAARDGELGLLRRYMRVLIDKGDPVRGAANIVSHMTEGAKDMNAFLKGFGEIRPEARDVLFHGERGQAYLRELEKLERVAKQMKPYEKMARQPGGLDLSGAVGQVTRPGNLLAAAGLYFHFWPTMMAVGGSAALARFMASPRYVRWLTQLPEATKGGPKSPEALRHLARLAATVRDGDEDEGDGLLNVVSELFLPIGAHAMPPAAKEAGATMDDRLGWEDYRSWSERIEVPGTLDQSMEKFGPTGRQPGEDGIIYRRGELPKFFGFDEKLSIPPDNTPQMKPFERRERNASHGR